MSKEIQCLLLAVLFTVLKMLENFKKLFFVSVNEEDLENYKRARGLYIEDPWERVKVIFSQDAYGNIHPELQRSFQIFQIGLIVGGGLAGVNEAFRQSQEFIRTNDANVYMSKNELYRKLTNNSLNAMGKGILKWGPKTGLFAGGFSLVASCCEAYRNQSGIIEYVLGGFVAGGISKSAFGIKGFTSGGIIGAFIGFIFGAFHVGVEKLTKTDALVLKYSQFAYTAKRKELFNKISNSSETAPISELLGTVHVKHTPDPLSALNNEN